jgi:6-phosphofructokinase
MDTHRIDVLTGGGDCPGLNAVLRGVTKAAEETTTLQLQEAGFSIIGVPETIDNGLEATSMTFKILPALSS